MPAALVGTIGAVTQGAAGAAVTPAFGAGENRTVGNKLICWVGVTGTATLPTTPAGWSIAKQIAGTSCSATIYYKDAAGSDAAPTIALITSGVIAASLAEYSGLVLGAPEQSGSTASAASPIVATAGAPDGQIGDLMLTTLAAFFSVARSPTLTNTYTNATAIARDNAGTSIANHYSQAYGITTANTLADKDSFALGATTSLTGMALVLVSFKPMLDVTVSDAVGHTEGAATQTLVHNPKGSEAVGVSDSGRTVTLELNPSVSDSVGTADGSPTAQVHFPVSVRDIVAVARENWVPNPSFEYDTLGGTLIGLVTPEAGSAETQGRQPYAQQFTALASGTVDTLWAYETTVAGALLTGVQIALFSDSANSVGSYLGGGTKSGPPAANAWWSVSGLSIPVTAGVKYWIATLPQGPADGAAYTIFFDDGTSGSRNAFATNVNPSGGLSGGALGAWNYIASGNWPFRATGSGAPALWSTADDGSGLIASGATAAVVADTNTADSSGTKAVEVIGDGVSANEGIAIVVTPPDGGGFKRGRSYVLRFAARTVSGSGSIRIAFGDSTTNFTLSAGWGAAANSVGFQQDAATATLYITNPNAAAYVRRIDAVLVQERASDATYDDGDTGAWAGTPGQSTSRAYGDVAAILLGAPGGALSITASDSAAISEALGRLLEMLVSKSEAIAPGESTGETLVHNPTVSDAAGVAETIFRTLAHNTSTSDAVGVAESILRQLDALITTSDAVGVAENILRQLDALITTSDAVGVAENILRQLDALITTSDAVGVAENVLRQLDALITTSQSIGVTGGESTFQLLEALVTTSDSATAGESTGETLTHNAAASDAVAAAENTLRLLESLISTSDAIAVADTGSAALSALAALVAAVSDSIALSEAHSEMLVSFAVASDSVATAESLVELLVSFVSASDAAGVGESTGETLVHNAATSDAVTVAEALALLEISLVARSESVTVSESTVEQLVAFVAASDPVTVSESTARLLGILIAASDSPVVSESTLELLVSFIAATDAAAASEATGETLVHNAATSDSVTVAELAARLLVSVISQSESVAVSESLAGQLTSFIASSDSVSVFDNDLVIVSVLGALVLAIQENVVVGEAVAALLNANVAVSEQIAATERTALLELAFVTLAEAIAVTESTSVAFAIAVLAAAVSDAVTAADSPAVALLLSPAVSDAVAMSEAIAALELSFVVAVEAVSAAESVRRRLDSQVAASEQLAALDDALAALVHNVAASDPVSVADALALEALLLELAVLEDVSVADQAVVLQALFLIAGTLTSRTSIADLATAAAAASLASDAKPEMEPDSTSEAVMLTSSQRAVQLETELS